MMWHIVYHPDVEQDLKSLGNTNARRIFKAIEERLINGEPEKIGKPLSNILSTYRRVRVGDIRIIYKVVYDKVEVYVIAIGLRRDNFIYREVQKRLS